MHVPKWLVFASLVTACRSGATASDEDAASVMMPATPAAPEDQRAPMPASSGDGAAPSMPAAADGAARAERPAAAPDGGPPPPPAMGIDCKAARFCDDFEAYTVGAAPAGGWRAATGAGGSVVVDSTQAFSGTKSVLFRTPMSSIARAQITRGKPLFPLPSNDFYGRMMVRMTAVPGSTWSDHWDVVVAPGNTLAGTPATYYLMATPRLGSIYHPHDCSKLSKTALPAGRWACLQWQFDGSKNPDGTTRDEIHMWLDGAALDDAAVIKFGAGCVDGAKPEWVAPVFQSMTVGWQNWNHPTPIPIEMWIDDVAVDEKPIACPTKG